MSKLEDGASQFRWPGWLAWRGEPPMALTAAMEQAGVPGAGAALIAGGAVAETAGWGLACAGEPRPVTEQTLFQSASISKSVTAACALRLVADGQLDLDEPVSERLRSWQLPANDGWQPRITLRQLLSHTAGLTVHGFPGYPPGQPRPSLLGVLGGRGNTPPVRVASMPGVQYSYSGGGYSVVQQLLTDVTGEPFAELARVLVLGPAGLADSGFDQPLAASRLQLAAAGHRNGGVPVAGRWHVYPEQAAAGLWSTPADLARFVIAIQQSLAGAAGALLPAALAAAMFAPAAPNARYGLGLESEGSGAGLRFWHTGGNEGFAAKMLGFAVGGLGAVVMTNADAGQAIAAGLLQAIGECCGWPAPDSTASPAGQGPAVPAARPGDYAADGVTVRVAADGSAALLIGGQPPVPLRTAGPARWRAAELNLDVAAKAGTGDVTGSPPALVLHQEADYTSDIELARQP